MLEGAPEKHALQVFAGLAKGVEARRFAESLYAHVAGDAGDEAEQQRVGFVHLHVFQHVRAGFKQRSGRNEAAAKAPHPLFARILVQIVQQRLGGGVDAAHALLGRGGTHKNAPASASARRTASISKTGSPM